MGVSSLKQSYAALFSAVPGIGTIDTVRIDPDDIPRKMRPRTPYWSCSISGLGDEPASQGRGHNTRQVYRTYGLRMEGWLGIAALDEQADVWEPLIEAMVNRLELFQADATRAGTDLVLELTAIRSSIDIWERNKTRAHHALITADVRTQITLTR